MSLMLDVSVENDRLNIRSLFTISKKSFNVGVSLAIENIPDTVNIMYKKLLDGYTIIIDAIEKIRAGWAILLVMRFQNISAKEAMSLLKTRIPIKLDKNILKMILGYKPPQQVLFIGDELLGVEYKTLIARKIKDLSVYSTIFLLDVPRNNMNDMILDGCIPEENMISVCRVERTKCENEHFIVDKVYVFHSDVMISEWKQPLTHLHSRDIPIVIFDNKNVCYFSELLKEL